MVSAVSHCSQSKPWRTANVVKKWILAEFEKRQERVKNRLHESKSRIHLSFDLWTSPNNFAFIGVVAWVQRVKWKQHFWGFVVCRGSILGKILQRQLLTLSYGLTDNQIGWLVLDNASSNDTCVAEILKALDIDDTVERRRLHCLGHVINLAAKSLFSANSDIFEKEIDMAQLEDE